MAAWQAVLPPGLPVPPTPPRPSLRHVSHKLYSTLGHLIDILEELDSKEDVSAVLRRIVAGDDGADPANSSRSYVSVDADTVIRLSQILGTLTSSPAAVAMETEHDGTLHTSSANLTEVSGETSGRQTAGLEGAARNARTMSLSDRDSVYLVKKLRDFEQRAKPLQEKNKEFLAKNMDLTARNRSLKEQLRKTADENNNLKETLDQSRCECSELSRLLDEVRSQKSDLESQLQGLEYLRTTVGDHEQLITSLRQACAEKDRRMEIVQLRKKRRLRMSPEQISRLSSPCSIVEDEFSLESDLSQSSMSAGSLSDDDVEAQPPDSGDLDSRYRLLAKEHLGLQRSTARLHRMSGCHLDPQRFTKQQQDLETDLFVARCKIESLQEALDKQKTEAGDQLVRSDSIYAENQALHFKVESLEGRVRQLTGSLTNLTEAYEEAQEQMENLEFQILEAQQCHTKADVPQTCDVATVTEDTSTGVNQQDAGQEKKDHIGQDVARARIEELEARVGALQAEVDMGEAQRGQYHATIRDLEDTLARLLQGQGSEVDGVMAQLKQADEHVSQVEGDLQQLQVKVVTLQQDKVGLEETVKRYHGRLDEQEKCLALTRDEREELLQLKPKSQAKSPALKVASHLKLAEMGHGNIRDRSHEGYDNRKHVSETSSNAQFESTDIVDDRSSSNPEETGMDINQELYSKAVSVSQLNLSQTGTTFDSRAETSFDLQNVISPRRPLRIGGNIVSVSDQSTQQASGTHQIERLQKQISELQEENDVLKYELTHKGHDYNSDSSDTEDPKVTELHDTCEQLRERVHSTELSERQLKDRLKLAERTINELEASESVLRDRVEEDKSDKERLKKQIMRLQKKIRDLKDMNAEKEQIETSLHEKVTCLEETGTYLAEKLRELEQSNEELQHRVDLQADLVKDVQLLETVSAKVTTLERENNKLNAKMIDLEEDNEVLSDNWKKVADEEANRRECLEEKIKVLTSANSELKAKLHEKENDIDLNTSGASIASEINNETIEELKGRVKELESDLQNLSEEKNETIEGLQEKIGIMRDNELKLSETLSEMELSERELRTQIGVLKKSEHSQEAATTMLGYVDRIQGLKSSQGNLLERLDSMEDHEDDLKQRLLDMEKSYERKLEMLEREIAEYQQQEDDLCARIGELDENEIKLTNKIDEMVQNEIVLNEKVEELECSEIRLTDMLENNENVFNEKVQSLEAENVDLKNKVTELEKHEHELSEKVINLAQLTKTSSQENSELLKSSHVTGEAKVEIANSVLNVANIEKESSACLKFENKKDNDILSAENLSLQEQVSLLSRQNSDLEKEQKLLNERLKKQEKKLKKSQRHDNVEDYDTLARKVVTYKLEVDQLRAENNDLHDRLMELDDSENELLEQNETLTIDLKHLNEKIHLLEDSEVKLNERINELECIETKLKHELLSARTNKIVDSDTVRQPSIDSAYESGKECAKCELIDKMIGTDDFMEGVMSSTDHGKPVSSMFERIQMLETENHDLSTKLSTLTATDSQVRQLSEKVKSLEENEDCLMERVMELEDIEDQQRRELTKLKHSFSSVEELEDELEILKENEKEFGNTIEKIELEKINLEQEKSTLLTSSDSDKSDLAMRLAFLQKQYDNEKKKVEALLKGEDKWMKTVSSEKKQNKEMEEELENTQQKLEDLQTEYEHKLSEKDESEKQLEEELNKQIREKEYVKKKFLEYEKSNSELEDEIEACKISESRMFHRHQQLISQNEELEAKVSQLVKLLPMLGRKVDGAVDGEGDSNKRESLMSDNPELISENPLTASVFSDDELELLRSQNPDTELLGSVPLDMLRKMKEFDEREANYQTKIDELESKNVKLMRKLKVLQGREKDLKHEMKDIQLELLNVRESTSSLRASNSSLDFDKSLSDDNIDSDNQSADELESQSSDVFKTDGSTSSDYKSMSKQQLILTVKLFEQKQVQEMERVKQLEDSVSSLEQKQAEEREMVTILEDMINNVEKVILDLVSVVTEDSFDTYLRSAEAFIDSISQEDKSEEMIGHLINILECVTGLRQRFEALQASEEHLRLSLAESQIAIDKLASQSAEKVEQLQAQIHVLAKLSHRYLPTSSIAVGPDTDADTDTTSLVEPVVTATHAQSQQSVEHLQTHSRSRDIHLEKSKIINIDVPPMDLNVYLGQSETIKVNVPPTNVDNETDHYASDRYVSDRYPHASDVNSPRMMDKAEDVLRQRIRELEKLEKHLRQQVLDLEQDRDELHDIARKDKTLIHEQNVRIRELQLAERNLQHQLKNFETNENTLYARIDDLESDSEQKDDRIRDLEILEGRLKELVKKYKLDEKILQTKSQTLESSVHEMTVKEETLKQKLQNLETEKTAFSERSEYLQMRLKELENAEADLAQRTKNQENVSQSLQNTVHELEVFGANAQARVVELEAVNMELMQRLHQSMSDNSPLSQHAAELQQHVNSVHQEVTALRDSDAMLKLANDELRKEKKDLQEKVTSLQLHEVEFHSQVRELGETAGIQRDKLSRLQRTENTLKYRIQELEGSGIQAPGDLTTNQQSAKLPRTLEDCQRRIITLQANNAELQSRVQQYQDISVNTVSSDLHTETGTRTVQVPRSDYEQLHARVGLLEQTEIQMDEADRLNSHLRQTVDQLREGKDACGHEVEIEVLRRRLGEANKSVKMLRNQLIEGQWDKQGPNGSMSRDVAANRQSTGTREDLIMDMVGDLSLDEAWVEPAQGSQVHKTVAKTTAGSVQSQPPRHMSSRDRVLDELMRSLEAPGLVTNTEDRQWRSIESRLPEADSRGSDEHWINVGTATSLYADNKFIDNKSHRKEEELELALTLQSETDSQAYDYDAESRRYGNIVSPATVRQHNELHTRSMHNSSAEFSAPPLPETRPPEVVKATDSFVESVYMPSSVQDSMEESEVGREVLRRPGVQAGSTSPQTRASVPSIVDSIADSGRGTASVSLTTSGMTLRERIANIERQLSARESDSAKDFNSEIDLTSWKAKVHESNRHLELAEKENKYFKDEINRLEKELEDKTRLYLILNNFLHTVEQLLKDKNIGSDSERLQELESVVVKAKCELGDSDHRPADISADPAALGTQMAQKDRELNAKRNEVDSLVRELRQWQQECRSIEDMRANALDSIRGLEVEVTELQNSDRELKVLKEEYNTLRRQVSDGEPARTKPQPPVAPLRNKIVQLTHQCSEKDQLIKKLVQELKKLKSGSRPSPLLEELCRLETAEDHNHNEIHSTSSQSSLESSDAMAYLSDTELIRGSSPMHRTSQQQVARPRSADYYHPRNTSHRSSSHLPRIHGNSGNHSNSGSPRHRGHDINTDRNHTHRNHGNLISANLHNSVNNNTTQVPNNPHFVAIADYDSVMFSQSGRQRLELSLMEGDKVVVTGPLDQTGYYEAEVNGCVGLVPASHIQPNAPRRVGKQHSVPGYLDASPERITQLYNNLQKAHRSDMHGRPNHAAVNGVADGYKLPSNRQLPHHTPAVGPPDVPSNFHVDKVVGNSSLMLAWQQLPLDDRGCSNGVKVTGYRIYKDNKVIIHPRGAHQSQILVENVDIHAHHRFGIQTVCAGGRVSELSEIMYEGVEVTSDENSDTESEMDMAAVIDQDEYKTGHKRMFMGVYDYDPTKHSPQDHPTCELTFNAGDIITVYGRQRADGFYNGEINGIRGLVPAFFIEEMPPQAPPRSRKSAGSRKQHTSHDSTDSLNNTR